MTDLSNEVVLITGASRGIGEAAAHAFAEAGARVVLAARTRQAVEDIAAEIGARALAVACDVSDYASVQSACAKAKETFGDVTILINNAGVIDPISHLAKVDPAKWAQAIEINLTGVFNAMRCVLAPMQATGRGTIITVSSGAAHNPIEGWSHYCASKAGAAMLTDCAHKELSGEGLRIMGLSPGTVATQMQRDIKASGINPVSKLDWSDHIPPEWPAKTLVWMCSASADEHLGQEISLRDDGIRKVVGLI